MIACVILFCICRRVTKDDSDHLIETSSIQLSEKNNRRQCIYYCQSGDEYGHFEKFCEKFLPGILIKEIESGQSSPQRLALVLFPSSANRQDPTNSLKQLLTDTLFNYQISDPDEIWIVQVSFDENNGDDPTNLMDRDTFEYAKADRPENIVWFINIVYKTNFEFST